MEKLFESFSYAIVMSISLIIFWYRLMNKKIDFKNPRLYISFISIIIISICNYLLINKFIRVTLLTIAFILIFKFLFKEKIKKSIIASIIYQIIVLLGEFIAVIILSLILGKNIESFIQTFFGIFLTNVLVALICVIATYFKFIRNLFNKLISITDKIKIKQLLFLCLILLIILNIFIMSAYYKIKFEYWVIANIMLIIIFSIILIYYLKTQSNLNSVSNKYNIALKSLNDYESMMSKYRIANHENKNLLLTIRTMILNKEANIDKFIGSMIEEKYNDDEKLLFKMSVIPSGGLRATIYSGVVRIREKNIKYSLNIDKKLKTIDLIELDTNTIIDTCKSIGVFIDNAIDEVEKLKNRNISISLHVIDNDLEIKISNNYSKTIDLANISNLGYTTKGDGHGYGLTLVDNLVKNNELIDHHTEINKRYFSQLLIIKYKKTH